MNMDMHNTVFNAFNEQEKGFDITELEYAFYDLCSILKGDRSKHSADVVAPKAVVYPRLERIKDILSCYHPVPACHDCQLWKDSQDIRVARNTVDRLCNGVPNGNNTLRCSITQDEAENLRKFIDRL